MTGRTEPVMLAMGDWRLPSFDPPPPSAPPTPAAPTLSEEEIAAVLEQARADGWAQGQAAGHAAGWTAGHSEGLAEGHAEGHRLAFAQATARLDSLAGGLQLALAELAELPRTITEPLVDLSLLIAQRLSGSQQFERAAFVQAVQEALMRLPGPGERLLLRVGPADLATWTEALDGFRLPFGHNVLADPDLAPGRVFIEVGGARLDIGQAARQALVRAALGLPVAP
jgi:flagellar assembly protein FliH